MLTSPKYFHTCTHNQSYMQHDTMSCMSFAEKVRARLEQVQAIKLASEEQLRSSRENRAKDLLEDRQRKNWGQYETIRINFEKKQKFLTESGITGLVEELQKITDGSRIGAPGIPKEPQPDGYYYDQTSDFVLSLTFLESKEWSLSFVIRCNTFGDITFEGSSETVFTYKQWHNHSPAIFEEALMEAYFHPNRRHIRQDEEQISGLDSGGSR